MPLAKKYNDVHSSRASFSNAKNQPSRTSTPVKTQATLLSYLQKNLPTPNSSGDRKVTKKDFIIQAPVTPITPSSNFGQVLERESSSLTEEFEESSLEKRSSRKPKTQDKILSNKRLKNEELDYMDEDEKNIDDCDYNDKSKRAIENQQNKRISVAFASNSTTRRDLSFSSSARMTDSEKKKQRVADFKAKNDDRYSWLLNVKDADGNPEGSPNYDPRTLNIPKSAWDKFTPFEKQFWEIKSQHWDTLYERDADIGHSEFDLKLTDRVNMRMVGVPEMSFESWAAQFIAKGYKVARVDQMETALGKEMREKSSKKKEEKIIRRELATILTAGTIVDGGLLTNDMSTFCMSIKESCDSENDPPAFGICFVDTATAEFHLTSFVDDFDRTQFETLIMQVKPKEIVHEKGRLSQRTLRILKNCTSHTIWTALKPDVEFWDANTTYDEIRLSRYFSKNNKKAFGQEEDEDVIMEDNNNDEIMENLDSDDPNDTWPSAIKEAMRKPLMLSALGGLIWYLRSLKLDAELVSLKNFHIYDPIRQCSSLILDGQSLANLEIFENSIDGSDHGTVFKLLNHCATPFGKRTFKNWLCHPLRDIDAINARLDAVEELNSVPEFRNSFYLNFSHFPDLERLISRIHAKTCKVKEFLLVLTAFDKLMKTVSHLGDFAQKFKSNKLLKLFEKIPNLTPTLLYFKEAFDYGKAENEGNLIPYTGIDNDYDEIQTELKAIDQKLTQHLAEANKQLRTTKVVYRDVGKEIYQLEVPNTVKVPSDWKKLSRTQKVNRYWNPTLQKLVRDLQEALEVESNVSKSLNGRFYEKFDAHYHEWLLTVKIIAELDCLLSLANSSSSLGEPCCRPQFVRQDPSILEFEELRHPCVVSGIVSDFIPNDTFLGGDQQNIILLTGPNMGGKSTLLRQNCIAIIMAQLGCYVPAKRCLMTPFDRIYTRIGANDNILAGQSTFMVELSETSKILHEATPRSMVILDELGRGTSTFDGYAIAYSVLHYLATQIGCLGLFSTHYGMLTQEFSKNPNIALKHMSCEIDQDRKEVTFLYKLVPGVCPKSYGMNVANMAGIPRQIVDRAEMIASKFEQTSRLQDVLTARSSIPITTHCDFVYLLKTAVKNGGPLVEDVGDRALDNQTEREKEERIARVLKAIMHGIKMM
ncbi:8518_t:CDS:10 [Diversispora eburnea]|uniref:DNA mismatch repair protein n=1 Tax=Diversispora eburnea TaxID=1213867 RepID=A0A9N9FMG0_9GLOM|nr:8518_t:CDS:10 [Diversispora eburnea]